MKVLFYMYSLNRGGAERVIANLSSMLAEKGHEVIFVLGKKTEKEYEIENVKKIILSPKEKKGNFKLSKILKRIKVIFRLRNIIKEEKPNIIIPFLYDNILIAKMSSLFIKIPILFSQRNYPKCHVNIYDKIIMKFVFPHADGYVFQTKEAQDFFSDEIKRNSTIINNLVDKRFFDTQQTEERKNIIGVGRLDPQKNWYIAIKAFSLIADKVEENFIIYYGIEDELKNLKRCVDELSLTQRVIFAGTSNEIEKAVVNSKLFILSSDWEGVPNALIEALILGVPCVSTNFSGGGADQLIESGVNGILVPKRDYEALAEAMLKVLTNNEYAERLGKNAKERAIVNFDPEVILEQWESYILSVIENYSKKNKSRSMGEL